MDINTTIKGIAKDIASEASKIAASAAAKAADEGLPKFHFSTNERDAASTTLILFFESLVEALEKQQEARATHLATESRGLCRDFLFKVPEPWPRHLQGFQEVAEGSKYQGRQRACRATR